MKEHTRPTLRSHGLLASLSMCLLVCVSTSGCGDDTAAASSTGGSGDGGAGGGGGAPGGGGGEGAMGGAGGGGAGGGPELAEAVWVSGNPSGRDGDALVRLAADLSGVDATLDELGRIAGIQALALDGADAYVSVDGTEGGAILVRTGLANATADGSLGLGDRLIAGPNTGLSAPRGMTFTAAEVIVADVDAGALVAFAKNANGDAAPAFTVADLGDPGRTAWGLVYDASGDRLFAACSDGVIVAYDAFSTTEGAGGPSRVIHPTEGGSPIATDLRGIGLVAGELVVTDVGTEASDSDGQLLVVPSAATANGDTAVRYRNSGATTGLGNPISLALVPPVLVTDGPIVTVSDAANETLLAFPGIFPAVLPPSGATTTPPATTLSLPDAYAVAFASARLLTTVNPSGRDGDGVVRVDPNLGSIVATHGDLGQLASLTTLHTSPSGSAVLGVHDFAGAGGFLTLDALGASDGVLSMGASSVLGSATQLGVPSGVATSTNRVFVADPDNKAIRVFSTSATGDAAPLFTASDLGGDRAVWGLAYDETADRLFASTLDGVVLVYDAFESDAGASGPARIIIPADDQGPVSMSLRGLRHVAELDLLVVADWGTDGAADGSILGIADASSADGETLVTTRLAGSETGLTDPLDVAVDGAHAYVADAAGTVSRFDDFLSASGSPNIAPTYSANVASPTAISLVMP